MLVYFALSSFLVGFYGLCDGRYWTAVGMFSAGVVALALHRSRKDHDDHLTPCR